MSRFNEVIEISSDDEPTVISPTRLFSRLPFIGTRKATTPPAPKVIPPSAPTISVDTLSHLPLANRVEKILGQYLEELQGDNEYWTGIALNRARLANEDHATHPDPTTSFFANLKPLQLRTPQKGSTPDDEVWGVQRMTWDNNKPITWLATPYTNFNTNTQDVPGYAHYVNLKNNLLAPNVIHLHCWPYFGDEFDLADAANLNGQYRVDIADRERKLLVLLQAQKYERYVESALVNLECSWADVLRFLLVPKLDLASITDTDVLRAYALRDQFCKDDFKRSSDRWNEVLNSLPPSTPAKLGRAAVLCEMFQKMTKFSLWHIARRCEYASKGQNSGSGALESHPEAAPGVALQPSDNGLTCRMCLRFNCPYHGQFKHTADGGSESDDDSIFSVDTAVATDIVHPFKVNYRTRVEFPPEAQSISTLPDPALRRKQKDANYWSGYLHEAESRGPFYPCFHPGTSCENANCSCYAKAIPCEKTCSCPSNCTRKFKGCACGQRKDHNVCFENANCVCWQLGRECDPDLCASCGVCDVVDPIHRHDERAGRCRNANIQRNIPKHTLLGDSGVHGLGLFACEHIRENEFVGEYKGEIITKSEGERRGAVYEHQRLSYLFSLNKEQEIDSTYFGNKMRFINHARPEKANLYPRIIMVNTVHRIALYAGRDIPAGKELLFNYGPKFPNEQLQESKKAKKSAPHVRNANLVKGFFEVSESEDEDGNLRAKAVSSSLHRKGGKGRKKGIARVVAVKKRRMDDEDGGARSAKSSPRKPVSSSPRKHVSLATAAAVQHAGTARAEQDIGRAAGDRLAAFNIFDDVASEPMDADAEAEDDELYEPDQLEEDDDASESEDSEGGGAGTEESSGSESSSPRVRKAVRLSTRRGRPRLR